MLMVRSARSTDADAIWNILEPILRAGESYPLPRDWTRDAALGLWFMPGHEVFVAESDGAVRGTYYLQANQLGAASHVANCGYATAANATGKGVATAMCRHSLQRAADSGFKAMQYNFVISSNTRAVALWQHLGFRIVGTIPAAFDHPRFGLVDAYVMHRFLDTSGS